VSAEYNFLIIERACSGVVISFLMVSAEKNNERQSLQKFTETVFREGKYRKFFIGENKSTI